MSSRKNINPSRPDALSFVTRNPAKIGGFNYWNVATTGNWSGDCEMGAKLGAEFLTFLGKHPTNGNATLLGCIVTSMVDNATAGHRARGAEVAFMKQINDYAMAVAVVVERPEALTAA
jgi:hypothetical protein